MCSSVRCHDEETIDFATCQVAFFEVYEGIFAKPAYRVSVTFCPGSTS